MPSRPLGIPARKPTDFNQHESAARFLVKQYLGDDLIDSLPRSVDDTFLNGKLARKNKDIANLTSQLVSHFYCINGCYC